MGFSECEGMIRTSQPVSPQLVILEKSLGLYYRKNINIVWI